VSAQIRNDVPVSVVITAYNSERFVADAIRTVRAQSVQPYEIIVVDDGSRDRTAQIATSLGVTVLTKPNGGSSTARNAGTRAACAPWIAYLDVDDLWAPDKLELQWTALRQAPAADFSFCEFASFNEAGIIVPAHLASSLEYAGVARRAVGPHAVFAGRESVARQLFLADFILQSSLLVRRDVVLALGGFDESIRRAEDYEFMLRLLAVADAAAVERRAVFYRIHDANKSSHWHEDLLARNKIADRIANSPHRYPTGADAHFSARRRSNVEAAAKSLLRRQLYRDAREIALASVRVAPAWPTISTIALSHVLGFPPLSALHSTLRSVKNRLAAPTAPTPERTAAALELSLVLPGHERWLMAVSGR
jgi:glycosyltransferase involved in cell wall biosynthesis